MSEAGKSLIKYQLSSYLPSHSAITPFTFYLHKYITAYVSKMSMGQLDISLNSFCIYPSSYLKNLQKMQA